MVEVILAADDGSTTFGVFGVIFGWLVAIAAYWAPTIVAVVRKVPNKGSVIVINLFLGWTVIGWVVALAMACRSRPEPVPPYPYPYPPQYPQQS